MVGINSNSPKCLACNSNNLKISSCFGLGLIYTRFEQKKKKFTFQICLECGYIENKDYIKQKFQDLNYDNFTFSSRSDSRDNELLKMIGNVLKNEFDSKDPNFKDITFIEFGPGKRLNLLEKLEIKFPLSNYFAVDPLFSENFKEKFLPSIKKSKIKYINHIKKLNIPKNKIVVFIARNSLEYLNINEISEIINSYIRQNCILIAEITTPNIKKTGCIYLFSEYLSFFSKKSLSMIFKKEDLYLDYLFSKKFFSDSREFIIAKTFHREKQTNIKEFLSILELINYCENNLKGTNFVMWGAGGRNIMFVLNEGKNIINKIVDIDEIRVGVDIPGFGKILPVSNITNSDVIVCLNSRFLISIKEYYPYNLILSLNEFD